MDCRGASPVFAEQPPPCIRPLSSTRRAPGCPFVGPRRALSFGSSREFLSKIGTSSREWWNNDGESLLWRGPRRDEAVRQRRSRTRAHSPGLRRSDVRTMSADFMCGWISGCTASLAGQPFDTVRVRIQTGVRGSPLAVARDLWAIEGARGFLRGVAPPLLATGPRNAIGFAVQGEVARRCLERLESRRASSASPPDAETARLASACAGGVCAGLAQCAVIVPADRIKVQQQVLSRASGRAPEPMAEVAARLVRAHGVVGGLLAGGTATALRQVPAAAMYFGIYNAVQPKLRERFGGSGPGAPMLAGGVAGVFGYGCTYPLDVIKARQQASGAQGALRGGDGRIAQSAPDAAAVGAGVPQLAVARPGLATRMGGTAAGSSAPTIRETIRCLNREVGPAWVVRGMGPTLVRAFVINAVNFAIFESLKARVVSARALAD